MGLGVVQSAAAVRRAPTAAHWETAEPFCWKVFKLNTAFRDVKIELTVLFFFITKIRWNN